ncbi:hypothetical protein P8C59_001242 [Phyllachora maydis]|uniref:Multifunctional fusion protein n=1 Tax=Phyllachora maydis TaxID=1825666 RepID=A0AAD9HZ54_9PEZI|nr:hypothetical protein P8C59_001242 [Phyllachora maydis]
MANEQINVPSLVVVLVLSGLIIRYLFFSPTTPTLARDAMSAQRSREAAVERIQQMFPQVDRRTILWDLQRNGGNIAATTERILAGRMEAPPRAFQPPPPPGSPTTAAGASNGQTAASQAAVVSEKPAQPDLITRYNLKDQVVVSTGMEGDVADVGDVGSQAKAKGWSSNREERQSLLRRRRDQMILEARRKMEAKLAAEKVKTAPPSGTVALPAVRHCSSSPDDRIGSVSSNIRRWAPLLSSSKTIVRRSVSEERVSIMYSVLPTSIQSRLPPLPSIRRTVGGGNCSSAFISAPSSGATTPISEAETAILDMSRTEETALTESLDMADLKSSYAATTPLASPRLVRASGVDWRCGRQGMDLVVNAVHESKGHMAPGYNPRFERAAYLDGVAYMLKGLPCDMDETEVAVLRRSLPGNVTERVPVVSINNGVCVPDGGDASGRNVVHSSLLFVLVYFLACVRFVLPYILLFFSELMRYEREYKVSENVLGTTMAGFTVGLGAMRRFGDGMAGQVLAEAFDYTAEGVSAALKDFAKEPRRLYSSEAEAAGAAKETSAPSDERVTRFSDLAKLGVDDSLVTAITQGMGYDTMTDVQTMTINPALAGKDLVAQAKTGTGKTLAFLVPIFQRILQSDPMLAQRGSRRARSDDIRAIIVSPTRELAEQIGVEARKLGKGTGIVVQTAVGDEMSGIAAPRLAALVLDEADRMLDVGFDQELREILRYLPDRDAVPRQTCLFSATIPKDVVKLARSYVDPRNFQFCQTISPDETPTHERIPQHVVTAFGMENMFPALLELLKKEHQDSKTTENALPLKAIVAAAAEEVAMEAAAEVAAMEAAAKCYAWDVVNEGLNEDGTYREDIFCQTLGEDYLKVAFVVAAAAADPGAKLYYNDYNIEYPGPKATAALGIVKMLKSAGLRIDGVGLQSHFIVGSTPSVEDQMATQQAFIDLGVEVALTELDIRLNLPANATSLAQQKQDYETSVGACAQLRECVGVAVWNFYDPFSWVPGTFPGPGDAGLWCANFTKHPAYHGVVEAFKTRRTARRSRTEKPQSQASHC